MIVDPQGFGKKVRDLRGQKNLTLHEMAKITRRSVSLLSQIETGKVSPSFSTMRIIADALDISLGRLILEDEANETRGSSLMEVRGRKVLTTQGGVQHQLLSHNLSLPFEFISFEIPPGPRRVRTFIPMKAWNADSFWKGRSRFK
jgi:transcriptional regulator with XRE-family HTH domain